MLGLDLKIVRISLRIKVSPTAKGLRLEQNLKDPGVSEETCTHVCAFTKSNLFKRPLCMYEYAVA